MQAGELSVVRTHVNSTVCGLAVCLHLSLPRGRPDCWLGGVHTVRGQGADCVAWTTVHIWESSAPSP